MIDSPLSALVVAWTTTMIAVTLFLTALALSRVWDSAIFFAALQKALSLHS